MSQDRVAKHLKSGEIVVLFRNYCLVCQWKNFENRSIFDVVVTRSWLLTFWSTLYFSCIWQFRGHKMQCSACLYLQVMTLHRLNPPTRSLSLLV